MPQHPTPQHHPIFSRYAWSRPTQEGEWRINGLGVRQRAAYDKDWVGHCRFPTEPLPFFDEEYFEWVDILEAVDQAAGRFTMLELGAGFGRWAVNAVAALRQIKDIPFSLVAVEAEPTHFAWLSSHLRDNAIAPEEHALVQAVVTAQGGEVQFQMGGASDWYGQAVDRPGPRERVKRLLRPLLGRPSQYLPSEATHLAPVAAIPLRAVLDGLEFVDLIDVDVQGEEARVLCPAIAQLDRKVRRIHIGTHNHEVEREMRARFSAHGWRSLNDYPCYGEADTPYGRIDFQDGVQTWLNPRLAA